MFHIPLFRVPQKGELKSLYLSPASARPFVRICLLFAMVQMCLIGAVSVQKASLIGDANSVVAHTSRLDKVTQRIMIDAQDAETGQRGYLLTGDKSYLLPYISAKQVIERDLADARNLLSETAEQSQRMDDLQNVVHAKMEELGTTIQLHDTKGEAAALALVKSSKGRNDMVRIRASLRDIREAESEVLKVHAADAAAKEQQFIGFVLFDSLITLIMTVGATLLLVLSDRAIEASLEQKSGEFNTAL